MSLPSTENGLQPESAGHGSGERVVYVLPESSIGGAYSEIGPRELLKIVWPRKWLIIAVTVAFAAASVTYALFATEWYRAEVLLVPSEEKSTQSLGGQLGNLAALAGVSVGSDDSVEAVATLQSREFARDFIRDFDLLTVFFADEWDAEAERWLGSNTDRWPDERDAIRFFHDNVLYVNQDRQTGLVTVAIEWTDPEIAATWANALVRRLNSKLRERSLQEAETNVAYLQTELARTGVVTLHQSIGRLLESELQKLMLARGNEEFAFRVIDAAAAPKERVRPKRQLIAVIGTLVGGMLASLGVLFSHAIRSEPIPERKSTN